MSSNRNNWSDLIFFAALIAEPDSRKRNRAVTGYAVAQIGIPLLLLLTLMLWMLWPRNGFVFVQSEPYAIKGTEISPVWELNEEDFLLHLNEKLGGDFPEFTFTEDYSAEAYRNCFSHRLENRDGAAVIYLTVYTPGEAEASRRRGDLEAAEWGGNIKSISLMLSGEAEEQQQEYYAKCLIGIFSPGAEDRIAAKLKLLTHFPQDKTKTVKAGNITYTRSCEFSSLHVLRINPK